MIEQQVIDLLPSNDNASTYLVVERSSTRGQLGTEVYR